MIQRSQPIRSTITQRGQTVVPATIRKHFKLLPADGLEWIIEGENLRVSPVRADPVAAFRGSGKGGATKRLFAERRADSPHG